MSDIRRIVGSFDVVIAGAGPAGMMSALAAADPRPGGAAAAGDRPLHAAICEHMDQPGVKLLATGGGRCNLTNTLPVREFIDRFGPRGRFAQPALAAMGPDVLREFLNAMGVPTFCPNGAHVFPRSDSAADVRDALWRRCRELGVRFLLRTRATGLRIEGGRLRGVRTPSGDLDAPRVILATGGKSCRRLGATGDGYELARQAGHSIVSPTPALTPLIVKERWARELAGVGLSGASIRVEPPHRASPARRRTVRMERHGDILFTHTGLSGPAVLDLSGDAAEMLADRPTVTIRIDLSPGTTAGDWLAAFDRWQGVAGRKTVRSLLGERLPAAVSDAICRLAGLVPDARAAHLSAAQRRALAGLLTNLPLTVTATGGMDDAMVTRGGVDLKEIDPRTLQSRLLPGLYLAGELLDLDGPCGGFNLQWAFSSGYLAGLSARTPTHRNGGML